MTDLEGEIWKDIKNWPFHQVSNKIRHGTDNSRERNPSSKLTESDIIDIRKSDWSGRQLAIKYKVSPRTIQNILHGRTWNKG